MARVASLAILAAGTNPQANDLLAEEYGKVIENVQHRLTSDRIKNKDLSGDPDSGSLEAKRFANATPQAYGTARAAGAGNKIKAEPVTIQINDKKEFVEELEEYDASLYGVDGLVARRGANHALRMAAYLDTQFYAVANTAATGVTIAANTPIEEIIETVIQECENTHNDFVDGVPRELMHLVLSPAYYGQIRTYLDKVSVPTVDSGAEEFYVYHGVETQSSVHLPTGCNLLLIVEGAVAQPVKPRPYTVEKIPLSDAYGLELFFYCGTKAVAADLIFNVARS